jgi:hypothetical protein
MVIAATVLAFSTLTLGYVMRIRQLRPADGQARLSKFLVTVGVVEMLVLGGLVLLFLSR